MLHSK